MPGLVWRVLAIFRPFRGPLALIALLVMTQKAGDLLVPFFAGRVIDAMAQHRAFEAVTPLIATAFLFWVCHGNLLPWLLGRVDASRFQYAAPRWLGALTLRHLLRPGVHGPAPETALKQAVAERGQLVLVQLVNSIVRVLIPATLPGLVTLALLLWWCPLIGLIALLGGGLDVAVTVLLNRTMRPRYRQLQALDYDRQRLHTETFRDLPRLVAEGCGAAQAAAYDARFAAFAGHGARTACRFLGFNFGRGLVVNLTNLLTWGVGAWYVDAGVYTLGFFLASLSWSTAVMNVIGAWMEVQKLWMESLPALRAYLDEMDAAGPGWDTAPAADTGPDAAAVADPLPAE